MGLLQSQKRDTVIAESSTLVFKHIHTFGLTIPTHIKEALFPDKNGFKFPVHLFDIWVDSVVDQGVLYTLNFWGVS